MGSRVASPAPDEEPFEGNAPATDEEIELLRRDAEASTIVENASIPTDPADRIRLIPIPKDSDGNPVCLREHLEYGYREKLSLAHSQRVMFELAERDRIMAECETDLEYRAEVIALCEKDIEFFFDKFVWTTDPRESQAEAEPFILYEEQRGSVRFWQDVFLPACETKEGILVCEEKSRGIGATWERSGEIVHAFLFHKGFSALLAMDIEDDLDDGGIDATPDTWFGKIRFILSRLPSWLVPGDLNTNTKLNKMRSIKNPSNGNFIKGRQYCGNIGRGRRYTCFLGDEFATAMNADKASESFSQSTRGVYLFWTPSGRDNEAARIRFSDRQKVVLTRHWTLNPTLGVDWYWGERKKWGRVLCASTLDIDYDNSSSRTILFDFDPDASVIQPPKFKKILDYDRNLPLYVSMDPGYGDPFAIVWLQVHQDLHEYRFIDFVQYERVKGEFLVPFILGWIPEKDSTGNPWPHKYTQQELEIIKRHGRWGVPDEVMGDAQGRSGSSFSGDESLFDIFEGHGVPSIYPVKIKNKIPAISNVVNLLDRMRFAPRCATQRTQSKTTPTLVECFQHWSWKEPPKGGGVYKREPKHDVYCHAMDAVQQLLLWETVHFGQSGVPPEDVRGRGPDSGRRSSRDDGGIIDTVDPDDVDPICQE